MTTMKIERKILKYRQFIFMGATKNNWKCWMERIGNMQWKVNVNAEQKSFIEIKFDDKRESKVLGGKN